MIVDSSALIAIVKNEAERDRCLNRLLTAGSIRLSTANLFETFMVVDRSDNPNARGVFDGLLATFTIETVPVTESQVHVAREAFAQFGRGRHPAKLNFGDCFAYALAKATGEPLLFIGDDFGQTDIEIA